MRKTKHRGVENSAYIEGMRQIRSSGAAGPHLDKRHRRARTRAAARARAVSE